VHSISWFAMVKWCNARSQKDGLTPCYTVSGVTYKTGNSDAVACNWSANGYRLPTEAEWEKAARGGVSGKRFPWGTDTISYSQANYSASTSFSYDLSRGASSSHPTYATEPMPYMSPVGSFAANAYGLHDMAGNVWEWCWDWYDPPTYVSGSTDPRGAAWGFVRVLRGDCWGYDASACRAADRDYLPIKRLGISILPLGQFGFAPIRLSHPSCQYTSGTRLGWICARIHRLHRSWCALDVAGRFSGGENFGVFLANAADFLFGPLPPSDAANDDCETNTGHGSGGELPEA
jgi:Sulfatase-modifying factor enzyme 1